MLGNLTSLLRLAPHSLVAKDVLPGSLALFAKLKALVPPCHSCHRVQQHLAPSIRQELKKHVSPLLDALLHALLTSDLMQPASKALLIQRLCCAEGGLTSKEPAPPLDTRVMPAEDSAARDWAESCDDAAGRLVLVQSALHNISTHSKDVQQGFVQCLPALFRLLQAAAPHCLALPCSDSMAAEPQEEEEEADLLFRCSVMLGALLSVVPGKLRSEAQRVIVAQVCACAPQWVRVLGSRSLRDMTSAQVITGGSGELSQYVAANVWGLQLRHLLPPPAVAQHAQQLVLLLGEAHCRGSMPHSRLQGYLAHLLVAALPAVPPPADKSISSLLHPFDALRSPSPIVFVGADPYV